jgi:hypothetical protein
VVGFYLRGQFSDGAEPDAELIVAGAVLAVLRTDLLIAERFELRESFFESRSHICVVSELENRDDGRVHQAVVWPPLSIKHRSGGSGATLLGFALPYKPDCLRYFDTTFFGIIGIIRLIMVVAILRQKPLLIPPERIDNSLTLLDLIEW